ncbi:hypothetical protein ACQP1W_08775 [Spirillospora sp. CA-255316]
MWETPATDSAWERLAAEQLAAVAAVDAQRLELERSRLPEETARLVTEPTYSVRSRAHYWERLIIRMEHDWAPDGRYIVDEYINDLESRDALDEITASHPVLSTGPLAELLAHLDERFRRRTVPDGGAALRPYAPRMREDAARGLSPLDQRWYRRPITIPWL